MKFMESIQQQEEAAEAYEKIKFYETNHPALFLVAQEAMMLFFAKSPFKVELTAPYTAEDFNDCAEAIRDIRSIDIQILLNKLQIPSYDFISEEQAVAHLKELLAQCKSEQENSQTHTSELSVEDYAEKYNIKVDKIDLMYLWREEGQVIFTDHRVALLEYAPSQAIEIPFDKLTSGARKPQNGEWYSAKFMDNEIISFKKIMPH